MLGIDTKILEACKMSYRFELHRNYPSIGGYDKQEILPLILKF